ncbi:MFS transporter [Saccharibacillus sp. CPCC 101409]|uniref:MFS transporter n=1 Tax=Saccharibacillus sp. CPCC 101409 TaxID=3058041 RepID=UPI002673D7AB|nr:MFS transporter [Saccharibacillus sp. CPCC 101409]MDO3408600.1 MFS transporter [Saccharibacillus sp. CPCC 101409]
MNEKQTLDEAAGRNRPRSRLLRDRDFMTFWFGETLAMFGARITALALPLVAAITLNATPLQMGILNAVEVAPYLLVTLFAGVWIDRLRKRPLLLGANIARALLLAVIPCAYALGRLDMGLLYACGFLVGVCTLIFDLSYQSYLPSLVGREDLVEGNSKLEISRSAAEVGGPSVAGALIGIMAAPFTILIHSVLLLISAVSISLVRKREEIPPRPAGKRTPMLAEIREGISFVFRNPYLKAIAGEATTYNFFSQVIWAVMILYVVRSLGIGAELLGFIMGAASVGSILGSLSAGYLARRFGVGPTLCGATALGCAAPLLLLIAGGSIAVSAPILFLFFFLSGLGVVISNIHIVSLRQTVTPDRLLGRMNASYRFVVTGAVPLGSLLGGWLGSQFGLRPTLALGSIGMLFALLWIVSSPIPKLRTLQDIANERAS